MKTLRKRLWTTTDELSKAFNKVRTELMTMGLLKDGSRLDEVECLHERLTTEGASGVVGYMGFYHPFELDGDGVFTAEGDGNIHIPAFYPEFLNGNRPLLDVLRHEFGHALADNYKRFFRGGIFKAAFGASYGEKVVFGGGDWTGDYVTKYASTMSQEDFSETFMLFMKHKGKLPVRYCGKRAIEKKWKAVAKIVKDVASRL